MSTPTDAAPVPATATRMNVQPPSQYLRAARMRTPTPSEQVHVAGSHEEMLLAFDDALYEEDRGLYRDAARLEGLMSAKVANEIEAESYREHFKRQKLHENKLQFASLEIDALCEKNAKLKEEVTYLLFHKENAEAAVAKLEARVKFCEESIITMTKDRVHADYKDDVRFSNLEKATWSLSFDINKVMQQWVEPMWQNVFWTGGRASSLDDSELALTKLREQQQ
jgi:hypothetical protein